MTNLPAVQQPTRADLAPAITFTPDQRTLLKRTVCPPEASDDEFKLFMFQCERSGLDPFQKQMFCVPRQKKIKKDLGGGRFAEQYITVHEAQPAEAGMLARALEFPDYRGVTACAVYDGDKIELDFAQGVVKHSFNPIDPKRRTTPTNTIRPLGAWALLKQEGRTPLLVWRDYDNETFKKMGAAWTMTPQTWIEKIARVAALRTAYPKQFGGLYIGEEIPSRPAAPAIPQGSAPRSLADLSADPATEPRTIDVEPSQPTASDTGASGEPSPFDGPDGAEPADAQWVDPASEPTPDWFTQPTGLYKEMLSTKDGTKKPAAQCTWEDLTLGTPDGKRSQWLQFLADGKTEWLDKPDCKLDDAGKARMRLKIADCADKAAWVLSHMSGPAQ